MHTLKLAQSVTITVGFQGNRKRRRRIISPKINLQNSINASSSEDRINVVSSVGRGFKGCSRKSFKNLFLSLTQGPALADVRNKVDSARTRERERESSENHPDKPDVTQRAISGKYHS